MPTCKDCLHIDACKNTIKEMFPLLKVNGKLTDNIIEEFGDYKVNNCKAFLSCKEWAITHREK